MPGYEEHKLMKGRRRRDSFRYLQLQEQPPLGPSRDGWRIYCWENCANWPGMVFKMGLLPSQRCCSRGQPSWLEAWRFRMWFRLQSLLRAQAQEHLEAAANSSNALLRPI